MITPGKRRWAGSYVLYGLILATLIGLPTTLSAAQTVRLTNGEWPPYTSESLPYGGLLTRLVSTAFAQEGISVVYGYFPWKRAYAYGKNGTWDGSVGWAPTEERQADYVFSEPVIFVDHALYHLKQVPFDWSTVDDLRKWRIGTGAGYSYGKEWDRAVTSGRLVVEEVTNDAMNLNKLLHGRVDAIAIQTDVAEALMRQTLTPHEAEQIVRHPLLIDRRPVCLLLSRKLPGAPELLTRFNRGLQRLRENGDYAAMVAEALQTAPNGIATAHRPMRAAGRATLNSPMRR